MVRGLAFQQWHISICTTYFVMMTFNFDGADISIGFIKGGTVIKVCCICFWFELSVMWFLNIVLPSYPSGNAFSGLTLFLGKSNCIFLCIEIHFSTLHVVTTVISKHSLYNTNLAAQNITGCSHRLSSGFTSQSNLQ